MLGVVSVDVVVVFRNPVARRVGRGRCGVVSMETGERGAEDDLVAAHVENGRVAVVVEVLNRGISRKLVDAADYQIMNIRVV